MLDSVTGSEVAVNVPVMTIAGSANITIEKVQNYGKYIEVLKNLGRLKENEKAVVDLTNKTLVADYRLFQYIPGLAAYQRNRSGFDVKLVEDAFEFLRKCRKKGCQQQQEYRAWCEEVTAEFNKCGIDKDFDYKKLKEAKSVEVIDSIFERAHPDHQGLKRVMKYYFNHAEIGPKLRKAIVRVGRQFNKMQVPPPPLPIPVAPPVPARITLSRTESRKPAGSVGGKIRETTGANMFAHFPRDADEIRKKKGLLRTNSTYVPALPAEKKTL